ncbi:peptide/nickel transport system substrate-binding protein [Pseudooceanicola antarcticus]|uniref:Peptide/nickel transport system substrate-binding protein n=1 Tax=Pseudooceanicola antarcticus TaxID=1247613 RepID=A0A285J871_9RHOB|nr:ABC transporter substrate-binding protein [Pseudooceanicola antarcticus]SNY56412.1 peptide/nickel transport system substrate-binding protein [Pseudooceanicola antarcticus]
MIRSTALSILAALMLPVASPSIAQDDSLTIAYLSGPTGEAPDPRIRYNGWLSNQTGVTETLMGLTPEMELYPRLAESLELVDPTTWRMTLREGLAFHDGSPVTSQSVIDSIAPILDAGSELHNPRNAGLLKIAGMEAEGDRVVVFTTAEPNAAFPWILTEPGVVVLGEPSEAYPINATGPYIFREAIADQLYRVEANPAYRDGAPGISEVRALTVTDPAAAALAFEAGDVDLVINYPETDFERITATGAQGFSAPTVQLYWLDIDATHGPLKDARIRRAVSLAIDRQGIVDAALSGIGGEPAGTLYPALMPWAADIAPTYDPAAAEALLAEAGAVKQGGRWMLDGEPLRIDLVTYASRAALPPTAELIQAYLMAIGIDAGVSIGEWGANNDAIASGSADMHLQAWGVAPSGDPAYFPGAVLHSEAGSNIGGYANPALDALLAEGRQTFDPESRKAIYDQVQAIIANDAPMIPVFHAAQVSVAKPGLKGFAVHPAMTYWLSPDIRWAD